MRVEVYKNLPKSKKMGFTVYSVRDITKGSPDKGKVVAHLSMLQLKDVTFSVGQAGSAEVKRTGVKNVHAFIRGTVVDFGGDDGKVYTNPRKVRYNPRTMTQFMAAGEPVHRADFVSLMDTITIWDEVR